MRLALSPGWRACACALLCIAYIAAPLGAAGQDTSCGAPTAPPPLPGTPLPLPATDAARSAEVDALFAPWAKRQGPGVAVLVTRRGRVLHMKGYGLADVAARTPITPHTRFDLASLSKQFTAMAVMQLAAGGQLSYADSLPRYLPAFAEHASEVTLRDLLGHTAGVQDYIALFRGRGPAYTAFPRAARGDSPVPEPSMAEMLDTLAARPLRFRAGMGWDYSNSGYVLAAAVVEKVARRPFAEYVRERIFQPAGMASTTFAEYGDEDRPGRARSYTCTDGGWTRLDYSPLENVRGAVGVVSTLEDLARWYAALDASSLVAPGVQAEAFRSGYQTGGQPTEYGFGWVVAAGPGEERAAHAGWWKGFRNVVLRYPREGLTVVLLSNDARFASYRPELVYRVARLYRAAAPAARRDVPGAARLAGEYRTVDGDSYGVRAEGGALWVTPPGGARLRLEALADGEYRVAGLEEDRFRFVPAADRRGPRMIRMQLGFGNTVRTWTVAYRK